MLVTNLKLSLQPNFAWSSAEGDHVTNSIPSITQYQVLLIVDTELCVGCEFYLESCRFTSFYPPIAFGGPYYAEVVNQW